MPSLGIITVSMRLFSTRFVNLPLTQPTDVSYNLNHKFVDFSNRFGGGAYNLSAAAELRFQRIQDSIATNPQFSFISPRYFTAYAESVFPIVFFIDGRATNSLSLDLTVARGFFQDGRMPPDFFRSNASSVQDKLGGISVIVETHPVQPGKNNGTVNSYTVDPNSATFADSCKAYTDFVDITIRGLYPNATGALLKALNQNLDFLFSALSTPGQTGGCTQVPAFV